MFGDNRIVIQGVSLFGEIARGTTATVFRGLQTGTGRKVAVKVIPIGDKNDPKMVESEIRAQREAHALALANHPNVAQVFDYGQTTTFTYLVQELIEGKTLKASLAEGSFTFAEIRAVMSGICAGLDHIHRVGIDAIRDVKPDNVMLRGGSRWNPVLIDFGLARLRNSTLTQVGDFLFTPAYASPEQCRGEIVDQRTDVWSAGATLFHITTGRKPFEGDIHVVMRKIREQDPEPASSLRPDIPPLLDAVIRCAMAKDPTFRYGSALELLAAIEEATADMCDGDTTKITSLGSHSYNSADNNPPWYRPDDESSQPRGWRAYILDLLDMD